MKKFIKGLAVTAMALSLVACGGGSSKSGGGSGSSTDNTLIVGESELNGVFAPVFYQSSYDGDVVNLVFDKLFDYDKDNKLQPSLAEDFGEISEDGLSATYKLKKGIKFSNGKKLTANDVKFTFEIIADKSYDGRYGNYVDNIVGYDEFVKGEAKDLTGIEVIDDLTVKFTFKEKLSDSFLNVETMAIMSKESFPKYKVGDVSSIKKNANKPIGTGPYTLKEWDSKTGAILEKNDKYWGEGYAIEKVIIKPVTLTTDFQELEAGNVDLLPYMIEPTKVGPATNNDELAYNSYARPGLGFITYNTITGATADVEVRKAMTYAFDRESFVKNYYECDDCTGLDNGVGAYVPATYQNAGSVMSDIITNKEQLEGLETYKYDIEKANKILDDAGWVKGSDGIRSKDGKRLEIKILAMDEHEILATLIPMWQKDWKAIGADVKVSMTDFPSILETIAKMDTSDQWNVFFLANSWTTDALTDINTTFGSEHAKDGGDNYSRISDAELDQLLKDARKELDPEKQAELYGKVAIRLNELLPVVPVYGNTYFDLYYKKLKGFETNSLYRWTSGLKDATIE